MAGRTPTRSTPIIWVTLAAVILWAGIALLAWIIWHGPQTTLRDPRRNLVAPIERIALAEILP